MKRLLFLKFSLISLILFFAPLENNSQSIIRQCIPSYASTSKIDNIFISQTVGQPYGTFLESDDNELIIANQGFQQSRMFVNLSISDFEKFENSNFLFYHKPQNNIICIENISKDDDLHLIISDMFGKIIYKGKLESYGFLDINYNSWIDGNYLVKIYSLSNKFNKAYKITILK